MLTEDDLTKDQYNAIGYLYTNDEILLIAAKGAGKCVIGYTVIRGLTDNGILKRVLVVSTAQVCRETWAKEADKWDHLRGVDYICLAGETPNQRFNLLNGPSKIVICNFENLAWLFETGHADSFDGLLIDEITKLKSVSGVGFKQLRKHLKQFKWRCGMSANPVAQTAEDIYGQMLIIDGGKCLGRNKERFLRK